MDRLNKIERLKDELRATDYIAIKNSEGINCSSYGEWKQERQALRDEINELVNMTDEEYEEKYPEEVTEEYEEISGHPEGDI